MSEILPGAPALRLDDYQALVAATREWHDRVGSENWRAEYADHITNEYVEMLTQHGNSPLLFLPLSFYREQTGPEGESPKSLRSITVEGDIRALADKTMDELSDNLWYAFDSASRLHTTGEIAVNAALCSRFGVDTPPVANFTELQATVINRADGITVINKYGLEHGAEQPGGTTSLHDNPLYLLSRSAMRLKRALHENMEEMLVSPPIASDLEQRQTAESAIGEYIIVLTYVAAMRLGWDMEDVAAYNFQKLIERETWGKPEAELTQGTVIE